MATAPATMTSSDASASLVASSTSPKSVDTATKQRIATVSDVEKGHQMRDKPGVRQHDGHDSSATVSAADDPPRETCSAAPSDDPNSAEPEQLYYPEGGLRAWIVIFGTWLCIFIVWGMINTFGVYQQYYSETILRDKSPDQIAWIGSFQYFLLFALGLFCGRAFDMGLLEPVFLVGIAVWVVCQMMLSLCTEYWQLFLCQGLGLGLANGIIFNLAAGVPAHWFKRRRAFAFGLQATGSSIGGAVLPIMLSHLIPKIGFPWTMRVIGFIGLVLLTIAYFSIETRLPPLASIKNGEWKKIQWVNLSAFKDPTYSIFCVGATIAFLGIYNVFIYNDIFTRQYNIPASAYFLSILNASSTFGRAIPGYYADKLGPFNIIVTCLSLASILLFVFPLCTSVGGLMPFSILYGAFSGTYVSIVPACIAGLGSVRTMGTRLGMCFFAVSIAGLIGTPIGGAILGDGQEKNWWGIMGFSGTAALGGTILIFVARMFRTNGKLLVRV